MSCPPDHAHPPHPRPSGKPGQVKKLEELIHNLREKKKAEQQSDDASKQHLTHDQSLQPNDQASDNQSIKHNDQSKTGSDDKYSTKETRKEEM